MPDVAKTVLPWELDGVIGNHRDRFDESSGEISGNLLSVKLACLWLRLRQAAPLR